MVKIALCLWGLYAINVYQAVPHQIAKDRNLNKETFASMIGSSEEV
jgi:hypothetical protein